IFANALIDHKTYGITLYFKAKQKDRHIIPRYIFQMIHSNTSVSSPYYIKTGSICDPHMQELNVWRSFINLPHRQGSYFMPLLSKCLLDPLKQLSLSGILFRITEKHRAFW